MGPVSSMFELRQGSLTVSHRALLYRKRYLREDSFDNIYITQEFRAMDSMRAKLKKATVLPLSAKESVKYIRPGRVPGARGLLHHLSSTTLNQEFQHVQEWRLPVVIQSSSVTGTLYMDRAVLCMWKVPDSISATSSLNVLGWTGMEKHGQPACVRTALLAQSQS